MIQLPAVKDAVTRNALGVVSEYLGSVPRTVFVAVTANATADTPFIVAHTLGVVPTYAQALADTAASFYATAADRKEWTREQIKARCSAANANLIVRVEYLPPNQ